VFVLQSGRNTDWSLGLSGNRSLLVPRNAHATSRCNETLGNGKDDVDAVLIRDGWVSATVSFSASRALGAEWSLVFR
jgi:hypothetical protein